MGAVAALVLGACSGTDTPAEAETELGVPATSETGPSPTDPSNTLTSTMPPSDTDPSGTQPPGTDDPLVDGDGGGDDRDSGDAGADGDGGTSQQSAGPVASQLPDSFRFEGALVSHWAASAAASTVLTDDNTMPMLDVGDQRMIDGVWFWDVWPVRDLTGDIADVDGWTVLMGLSADISDDRVPGDRHGLATWRAAASRDGETWTDLGPVFPEGEALGARQWAGSSVYDPQDQRITMYYTALGELPGDAALGDGPATTPYEDISYTGGAALEPSGTSRQEIVEVAASVDTSGDVPAFTDFTDHEIVLAPDGDLYRTAEQSQAGEGAYIFRDPWWYRDPATEREYLLFAASPAYAPDHPGGVIGLATRDDDGDWFPLPPILSGAGVNRQLERPHLYVDDDGAYELFVTSHGFSFVNGLQGPAGLYGFEGDHLRGRYVPMNGSGLVMANPLQAPQQAYSWVVVPTDDGPRILSFVNYVDLGDVTLSEIGDQSPQWQRDHFGGTPAPLVELRIDGSETSVGGFVPLDQLAGS